MSTGSAKKDHATLRALSALIASLPASENGGFREEFDTEYEDVQLTAYLATLTKSSNILNEVCLHRGVSCRCSFVILRHAACRQTRCPDGHPRGAWRRSQAAGHDGPAVRLRPVPLGPLAHVFPLSFTLFPLSAIIEPHEMLRESICIMSCVLAIAYCRAYSNANVLHVTTPK